MITLQNLVALVSYHARVCWGVKNLGTLPKIAGPCSTVKHAYYLDEVLCHFVVRC